MVNHDLGASAGRARVLAVLFLLGVVTAACTGGVRDAQPPALGGPARVVDGDTLVLGGASIRLHGIDAPERDQTCGARGGGRWPCGRAATERLEAVIAGRAVDCVPRDRDRYGRIVAACTAGGRDLGMALVDAGLAWAAPAFGDTYVASERAARARSLGIWQAVTERPRAFRAAARRAASPDRCLIKGNVARSGARIYHLPGQPFYDRTVIDPNRDERWFCDEAAAREAGFRIASTFEGAR